MDAQIVSEFQLNEIENGAIRRMFERPSFVYAHGKLMEDYGTDIIYIYRAGKSWHDEFLCYTQKKEPVFLHLYRHPRTLKYVGIATYANDTDAWKYGRALVEAKPDKF